MVTVASRGEINTAFLLLAHMPEADRNQVQPYKRETTLLKHVIFSGQVSGYL